MACTLRPGPPGSGKTRTAGRLIAHLLARGRRVGVSSTSRGAIHHVLDEVEAAAVEPFRGLKKCSRDNPETYYDGRLVESETLPGALPGSGRPTPLGTAWPLTRPEHDRALDYLFDEAGQVSLADALALGTCARTLVLLGDSPSWRR